MSIANFTGPTPAEASVSTTAAATAAAPSVSAEQAVSPWHEATQRGRHDELAALMRGDLGAMVASSRAVINGLQALNAELIGFVRDRVRHGLDHGRDLAACGSPREALELQAAYVNDALRAYADELARLGELAGKLMDDGWSPLLRRSPEATTSDTGGAADARRAASS